MDCEVLEVELVSKDPMHLFQTWLSEAKQLPELNELPNTMTLATVGKDGGPSARSVLLRGLDDKGFKMYWDKRSPKSTEINSDARGALVFVWNAKDAQDDKSSRQVRVEGLIEPLSEEDNTSYFNGEPLMAQIRATVCHQSQVVTASNNRREQMIQETQELWSKWNSDQSPSFKLEKPSYWGGYRLVPSMMEFYSGKMNSINDRIRFRKIVEGPEEKNLGDGVSLGDNGWVYERLEP